MNHYIYYIHTHTTLHKCANEFYNVKLYWMVIWTKVASNKNAMFSELEHAIMQVDDALARLGIN